MLSELNDPSALSVYERALELAPLAAERRSLRRRMEGLEND